MTYRPQVEDVIVKFQEENLSKYGFLPALIWYLTDFLQLPKKFKKVTVKKKRNHRTERRRGKYEKYPIEKMCMGIVVLLLMGVKRLGKINHLLCDEKKIAELLGMEKFFDQSVAHAFLNSFHHSHVDQLDKISTELLRENGESFRQDIIVLDIDSQTKSLESRQREKAVVGYNRKHPGKPCYQWIVAFVRGEVVEQRLVAGNENAKAFFKHMVKRVRTKLGRRLMIIRVDGGYFAAPILDFVVEEGLQVVMSARYDWIMAQGYVLDNRRWRKKDAQTRLYDLGYVKVLSTTEKRFRVVLVQKQQEPFPGSKSKRKILHYAIVENLFVYLRPEELFDFYHEHQTIENHFKESDGPFNSGKMPSQKFQANRAFLQFVVMAENCFTFFKKTFFQAPGKESLWKHFAIR